MKSDERWQMNEMKNGERETQTYESWIDGFLRSPQGIEMKHVKWQWNHGNDNENSRNMTVDPKNEN